MSAEAAMKILIALGFTYLYCRRRGYSELASVIGAISFGFGGFLISWLHFPIATVACFAPAVLYCIDLLAERATFGRFAFSVATGVAIVFGGHPETAAHLFLLGAAYAVWIALIERSARFLLPLIGAVVVAAFLAAPYLAPLFEAVRWSMRYHELKAEPLSVTVGYGDWRSAVLLLQPHFFGEAPLESPWGPAETEALSGYAGVLGVASWIAIAISRRRWRSRETFYALATLAALGVILNWPGFSDALHAILPMMAHTRVRLLLVLLLSIQTAAAIDLVRRTPLLLGIAAVGIILFVLLHTVKFPSNFWRDTAVLTMLPSVIVLALATIAIFTKRKLAFLGLIAAITAELFFWGRDRNPFLPAKWMYPRTPLIEALDALKKKHPNDPFRIAGVGGMLYPNTQAVFGFADIRVHDAMANERYVDFMQRAGGLDVSHYHPWWERDIESRTINFLNVRYLVTYLHTPIRDRERFKEVYRGPDGAIFENRDVLPRFYAEGAHVRIVRATPTDYRLHITAPLHSFVASSVPWYPGWKVTVNGKRIDPMRVSSAFLGFAIPPGETDVRVWYSPWTFRYGVVIALITLACLFAFPLYVNASSRKILTA
jgi:hypothetical protein